MDNCKPDCKKEPFECSSNCCCCPPKCNNEGIGGIGIIILLIVLYFLFCNGNDKEGFLGGLF